MATAEQAARAKVYRDAAGEHMTVAQELYESRRSVLASYVSGLAVECMLRAYRHMIDPEFDARHEVGRLFKLARFADAVPVRDSEAVGAALSTIMTLWSNNHRFLTLAAMRKQWVESGFHRRIKGDFVKDLVRRMINAAELIVAIGEARWTSSFSG